MSIARHANSAVRPLGSITGISWRGLQLRKLFELATEKCYASAGLTLLFQILAVALGAVNNFIMARLFGLSGRGIIAFIQMISSNVGSTPLNCGLGIAGTYISVKRKSCCTETESTVFWASLAIGFLPFIFLLSPQVLLRHAPNDMAYFYLLASLLVIPALVISANLSSLIVAHDRILLYNAIRIITPAVLFAALSYLLIVKKPHLHMFVIYWILGNVAPACVAVAALKSRLSIRLFRPHVLWSLLKFGGMSHISNLLQMFCDRLDLIFVALLFPVEVLGLYAVATSIAETMWMVPQSISPILLPLLARSVNGESRNRTTRFLAIVIVICAIVALAIAAAAIILIPRLLPRFAESVRLIWLLLPGVLISCVVRIVATHLIGTGVPKLACVPPACGVIAYIVIGLPSIIRWHLLGAALSSDIAYAVAGCVSIYLFVVTTRVHDKSPFARLALADPATGLLLPR